MSSAFNQLALAVPVIGGICTAIGVWTTYRVGIAGLRGKGTDRLEALAQGNEWRFASPMRLQIAVRDALGVIIDDGLIRFAFERHRGLHLLEEIKRTRGMLRMSDDNLAIVRTSQRVPFLSDRQRAILAYASGMVPYISLYAGGSWFRDHVSPMILIPLFIWALIWLPFSLVITATFEAAHRLTTQLDERYPKWDNVGIHGVSASRSVEVPS